ncbi:MAG: leucyl aminopeptidase family protein, partial [Chloroflexota bacterium]
MTTTFRSATDLSDVAEADTVVVPVCSPLTKEVAISGLDSNVVSRLLSIAEDGRFTGKHGATLTLPVLVEGPIRRVVLVGLGSEKELTTARIASAAGSGMQAARNAGAVSIALVAPDVGHPSGAFVEAWVTGGLLGLYRYTAMQGTGQSENGKKPDPRSVAFVVDAADSAQASDAITRGGQIASAVALARDLVNEPAATMTPAAFADRAVAVAREAGLEIEVVEPAELQRMGANALLAVGQGSANPPRLIRMRYRPNAQIHRDPERIIGLVGKCITFDTGGYSIKTYEGMLEMKGDMAGGAAVLATMSVLPLLNCPYAVDATIFAADNMISGNAFRPGDVLTALNGITIEVLSTDAEG